MYAQLRELLNRVLRVLILTYIMGHTLTMLEETTYSVCKLVKALS